MNWKGYGSSFNNWIEKRVIVIYRKFFPEPYSHSKNKIKGLLDLSNYATKFNLKGARGNDTTHLATLKSDVMRSDVITPTGLS